MFNVLMTDIDKQPFVHYSEYADDIAIYAVHIDENLLFRNIQHALNSFSNWVKQWGLNINVLKTKTMVFSRKI